MQRRIDTIIRQTNKENKQRAKEIEILVRAVAELKTGLDGSQVTIIIEGFELVLDSTPRRAPDNAQPSAPEIENGDDNSQIQPENTQQRLLTVQKAIRYIPILNGDNDICVEDFITEVLSMRNLCLEKELLLKAIKVEKIIRNAAQSIQNIRIENYADLCDATRQNQGLRH
jgi:hypothetical protein